MAIGENIKIAQPNFCRGPQLGTICTIDTTNPTTVLRVKDTGGNTIIDLALSSNITSDDIRLEYTGPTTLTSMVDDLTFFTFEKVNDTKCMIKRWVTRMSYVELLLKEQVVKQNIGTISYNAIDFAVEYYNRTFAEGSEYTNYLYISDRSNIKTGTKLFLGPSSDTDNLGATESVTVSHIANYAGQWRVYLTSHMVYQYVRGDYISLYTHVYVYSGEVTPGDDRSGSLIKHDAYDWSVTERDVKNLYKRVTASKWCPQVRGIASVVHTNMLFIMPYNYYLNWRSMFMNNVEQDKNTVFEVHDVVFDGQIVYKLQKYITLKDDYGDLDTENWDAYNYQEDTLAPYSNNLNLWVDDAFAFGFYKTRTINAQVRDQYHVGLRDVVVNFYIDMDQDYDDDAYLWPLSGYATTDLNGECTMDYRTGYDYYGTTFIKARGTGSTNATGSEFVWAFPGIAIKSLPNYQTPYGADPYKDIFQRAVAGGNGYPLQIDNTFKVYRYYYDEYGRLLWGLAPPAAQITARNYFTSPGGRWGDRDGDEGLYEQPLQVKKFLPELYIGEGHTDGPAIPFDGYGFKAWPVTAAGTAIYLWANQIRLVADFESDKYNKAVTDFKIHHGVSPIDPATGKPVPKAVGWPPYLFIKQPEESNDLQISQLKLSLHTHWLDGEAYDELTGYVTIDQFVFVEDAIPAFWSEKNPVDTDIWIRLRPFAYSLDNSTLRMWIKVVSSTGDTGYYEVTDDVQLDNFDAGGGTLGIEVLYNPPQDLPYGSLIFVKIYVYDEAYIPNFVMVEYWFYITPDYKAPYLSNLSPSREEINVPVDTSIYFEINDVGTGVNVDSLELLLNSRMMDPNYLTIDVVSNRLIKVTYAPPELYFSKAYKVTVKANDSSPQENRMVDSYTFYTADSTGLYITDMTPSPCKRGMNRFEDVSAVVLADGNGIDLRTLRMQVFNKDVHPRIRPIVYRIS